MAPGDSDMRRAMGMGIEVLVTIGGLALLGGYLDARLGTKPWLLLVGTLLGTTTAAYLLIREQLRK